jgi:hypothetical protein
VASGKWRVRRSGLDVPPHATRHSRLAAGYPVRPRYDREIAVGDQPEPIILNRQVCLFSTEMSRPSAIYNCSAAGAPDDVSAEDMCNLPHGAIATRAAGSTSQTTRKPTLWTRWNGW